jgi:glycerol uptake facilitator-like aquaporin
MAYKKDNLAVTITVLIAVAFMTAVALGVLRHRTTAPATLNPAVTLAIGQGH